MASQTILVNASFAPSLLGFRGALLQRMVEAGHRVHVSAPGIDDGMAGQLRAIGVTPHNVPLARTGLDPRQDLRYRAELRGLIAGHDVDLVLGYTIKPCVWGALAARDCGIDSVSLVTGMGYAFIPQVNLRQRLVSIVSRRLWRRATAANRAVIFQNPDDRREFVSAGMLADASKAKLVDGSGVDMERYPCMPLPRAPRFLMIARLLHNKGVREYAEAAIALKAEGVDASFALLGYHDSGPDGIDPADLERWQSQGLEYLGARDDVRPALAACSVFVLPSYREGTPRTVLEAMATARPIITSDAPGCRETIIHDESGLLVPPRNERALVDAMRRLGHDPDLRARMAKAAWDRCAAKYNVHRVNAAMMKHLAIDDITPGSRND